ncbi:hypothetical protein ACFXKW_32030 [Streptomyces sp. NPDC059193]|uniref:hypothetical protein n=1 Tax=Streptomyces sp. NPDC059193 TaxID=3346763 RepID=UPI0036926FC4
MQGSAGHAYSGEQARHLLRHRWDWANQETWFENDAGWLLGVVTNGERAMVVRFDRDGGPGEHLVDPHGTGTSGGYLLSNGQVDSYDDRDTVTFEAAARAVAYFIDHGTWPAEATVQREAGPERA